MEIEYTTRFKQQYKKADKEIKAAFSQTIDIFLEDPNHPSLRNRKLKGKFSGYRSIDVTQDWRAIFKENSNKKIVIFHLLGTHKQLYE